MALKCGIFSALGSQMQQRTFQKFENTNPPLAF